MPKVDLNAWVSEHFQWKDYLLSPIGYRCGVDFANPPQNVIDNILKLNVVQEMAYSILGPIVNQSGWRPEIVNNATPDFRVDSAHLEGAAVDMLPTYASPEEAFKMLVADAEFMQHVDQLIIERGVIHLGGPCKASNYTCRKEAYREAIGNLACV